MRRPPNPSEHYLRQSVRWRETFPNGDPPNLPVAMRSIPFLPIPVPFNKPTEPDPFVPPDARPWNKPAPIFN